MTTSQQQSAIIYDFAALARARAQSRHQSFKPAMSASPKLPTVEYGSGGYHEAAIAEERARKP